TGRRLADQVGYKQAEEQLALDRCEKDRRARPGSQRVEPLLGQRVDGALAGLARLLPGGEVAKPGEPLRLNVVLALTGPGEDPPALGHPQQVVRARAAAADETEDLIGEKRQLAVDG